MKHSTLYFIITLFFLVKQVNSQKNSTNIKSTLQSLQKILHHMSKFKNNLQELKKHLVEVKKFEETSKNRQTVNTKAKQKVVDSNNDSKIEVKKPRRVYSPFTQNDNKKYYKNIHNNTAIHRCNLSAFCRNYPGPSKISKKYDGDPNFLTENNLTGEILKGCGNKHYYFGSGIKKTFTSVWTHCCKIGFMPVIINNVEDLQCINSLFKNYYSKSTGKKSELFVTSPEDIMLDGNFWICEQYKNIPVELWAPDKPDNLLNMESCTALKLSLNDNDIGFDDVQCWQNVAKYLCEITMRDENSKTRGVYGQIATNAYKSNYKNAVTKEDRCIVQFPPSASKGAPKFNRSDIETFKRNMKIKGEIIQGCGENRYLLFLPGIKKLVTDVWAFCGKFGFNTLKIKEIDELYCVNSIFKKLAANNKSGIPKSGIYAIFAYDPLLDGNFWICGANITMVSEELWAPKKPNNIANIESCAGVILSINDKEIGYEDVSCFDSLLVICDIEVK